VICGAEGWTEIEEFVRAKEEWFNQDQKAQSRMGRELFAQGS
jgi:hypothetical protein